MRLLLTTLNAKYIHVNLAIRLLYSLNHEAYPQLAWREFTIKEEPLSIAQACAEYEVVAFSCYIWNISQTLEVCALIKSLNPQTKILLGGPEVSYDWQDIIALPQVDYIITGEGEIPFRAFLEQYPHLQAVPSLISKTEGEVHYNPEVKAFDLQEYAAIMPYRFDAPETLANRVLYLETSRGCPYKCEFCLASLDNKVRYLPNDSLKATLLYLMQHGKTIKFLDRTFNIKKAFTLDIFEFILQHHRPDNVFQFEITADIVHPDIVSFIQERVPKGLFRFEIGIQTVNQKANLEVQRKQNFEKTKAIILSLQDKVEMHLDLIVGLALDYMPDIRYSFEEVFKLFPPELQLGFLKFLKGTPVRDKYEAHGFVFDPNPPYQIIESNYLSREELHQITQLEHALEIYWNKRRAEQTLRYVTARYSIFDFLQGLGAYFGSLRDYHRYTLKEVYSTLWDYAAAHYPQDQVLQDCIRLDYYRYHKVRPQPFLAGELDKASLNRLIEGRGLNKNYRYIGLPLHFDWATWQAKAEIKPKDELLLLRYDGQGCYIENLSGHLV